LNGGVVAERAAGRNLPFDGRMDERAKNSWTWRWGTSVARRPPCRWNPLLLPGGVQPRSCHLTSVR